MIPALRTSSVESDSESTCGERALELAVELGLHLTCETGRGRACC